MWWVLCTFAGYHQLDLANFNIIKVIYEDITYTYMYVQTY